jgi:hypothetical protein
MKVRVTAPLPQDAGPLRIAIQVSFNYSKEEPRVSP